MDYLLFFINITQHKLQAKEDIIDTWLCGQIKKKILGNKMRGIIYSAKELELQVGITTIIIALMNNFKQ